MKKQWKAILLAGVLASGLLLTACGGDSTTTTPSSAPESTPGAGTSSVVATEKQFDDITLKVGASPAPHAEILEEIVDDLAEIGIILDIVEFSDYVLPNTAVDSGDLDANFFQHLPYLENFNEENGTDLVSLAEIHLEPMGVYPGKSESLDEIPDSAVIGIPSDATNGGRALLLLESLGVITLKEGSGYAPTVVDVEENPHNVSFFEIEAAQLPASLPDLDFAVINGNYAIGAEINDTVIASEGRDTFYGNVVAIRAGDEDRPELKALVEALQSEKIRSFIEQKYGGEVVPLF